jgi:hypothetical protein
MTEKPTTHDDKTSRKPAQNASDKSDRKGLAEKSVTEHHIPGADGRSGAQAEEDNNP